VEDERARDDQELDRARSTSSSINGNSVARADVKL
jgi:hypothetical protein